MTGPRPARPLLVSADDVLLDELLRLCAAAGVDADVAREPGSARRGWSSASVVLVGGDAAQELATSPPPRRPGVHVVTTGAVPDLAFRWALQVGAEDVAELPSSSGWLAELLTEVADGRRASGVSIGVIGGSGGVGASVFSAALATVLGAVAPTLLLDADPLGAGLDRVLGVESLPGVRWGELSSTTGRLSGRSLRDSLPRRDGVSLLTWAHDRALDLPTFLVREVLAAGRRGHDAIVVDLPRHRLPAAEEVLAQCDHVVLLSGASLTAVTAACRVARRLDGLAADRHLVVRGARGADPAQVAALVGLPLVAAMSDQRGLDEAVDLGVGPLRSRRGVLAGAAREVAGVVSPTAAGRAA